MSLFLRRLLISWLTFRSFLWPKWLVCRVEWTQESRPQVYLNGVPVDGTKVQGCLEIAHQAYMREGLFLQDVASVEFEVMSTSTSFAYFTAVYLHGRI